jgi:hypothetical protein
MLEGTIITSSAGSLCVAAVAVLVFLFQYRLYLHKPDKEAERLCGWQRRLKKPSHLASGSAREGDRC